MAGERVGAAPGGRSLRVRSVCLGSGALKHGAPPGVSECDEICCGPGRTGLPISGVRDPFSLLGSQTTAQAPLIWPGLSVQLQQGPQHETFPLAIGTESHQDAHTLWPSALPQGSLLTGKCGTEEKRQSS